MLDYCWSEQLLQRFTLLLFELLLCTTQVDIIHEIGQCRANQSSLSFVRQRQIFYWLRTHALTIQITAQVI